MGGGEGKERNPISFSIVVKSLCLTVWPPVWRWNPPVWRWNPPLGRWNRLAAENWGAGIHQCGAGIRPCGAGTHHWGHGHVLAPLSYPFSIRKKTHPTDKAGEIKFPNWR